MITIGCAGFPVPATRYFKEFLFVEVQETHVTMPGTGTVRRWRREAPPGFVFTMVAPKELGLEAFLATEGTPLILQNLQEVGKELGATLAVFIAPPDMAYNKANKAAVKAFLGAATKTFERVVLEPPASWDPEEADALAAEAKAIAARDPLIHGTSKAPDAYYRLPGPAGHKSRYEDPAIEKLAALASASKNKDATYVFTNVDMFADAKRLKKLLKL